MSAAIGGGYCVQGPPPIAALMVGLGRNQMKEFQLCGLGNAIVDIFLEVADDEFKLLGFERGGMQLVDLNEQKLLLHRYQKHEPKLVSGGSVANSTIAFSQLGGDAAFIGCVGDDRFGLFYASEF